VQSITNQLRLDPLTGRWVAVSQERAYRPSAFLSHSLPVQQDPSKPCPFCPGFEEETPPALETYGPSGSWTVRIVPNLYPAFAGDEPMVTINKGPIFTQAPASGLHEVLVLTPDHSASWSSLEDAQIGTVMAAIRDRFDAHSRSKVIRYSQLLLNYGREAGASVEHPHGQLIGISFVPHEIAEEMAGFSRFVGGCLLCATTEIEETVRDRLIDSDEDSITISPYWSASPYEMLIIPRTHGSHLHLSSTSALSSVGRAVKGAINKLESALGQISYNLVLHSAPYRSFGNFHWHIHLVPKLTTTAGFELGTGVAINVVSPEQATSDLTKGEAAQEAS
jgi:UDPglucose--hexose-1-phosphate uridylyltransferase